MQAYRTRIALAMWHAGLTTLCVIAGVTQAWPVAMTLSAATGFGMVALIALPLRPSDSRQPAPR